MGYFVKRGRRALAIFGFAAAVPALLLAAQAPAASIPATVTHVAPALWVVRDADTTIYLFGTFHALDGRANWFDRSVRSAFDSSDSLVLETLIPDRPVLPKGPPPVALQAASHAERSVGMRVDQGADAVLRRTAVAVGKPVAGLESFEFQIDMYRKISPPPAATHAPAPVAAVAAVQLQLTSFMAALQQAWVRGEADKFEAVVDAVNAGSPSTYRILFADRNANWARWIGNRLDTPGTVFVAVGTGHLVGKDSVQAKLAQRGIASARVS